MARWVGSAPLLPLAGPRKLSLGLGLIGIGKPWGHVDDQVPGDAQVEELLATAVDAGVHFLDTAPSYGCSEARLGRFLQEIDPARRAGLTVATKFGEHWDGDSGQPYVDHSYEALARSLDGSLQRLGGCDCLQLHKTTPEALRSKDVERAYQYASSLGISNLGASVSDLASASLVLATEMFSVIQIPFNLENTQFLEIASEATERGMVVLTNRPFGMGRLLHQGNRIRPEEAFRFLVNQPFEGVVLTGTKSVQHLRENIEAFQTAILTAR